MDPEGSSCLPNFPGDLHYPGFPHPKGYQTMNGIMTYLRPASPLAVLAIGEMFVLAMGGFDLSIGAIVTFVVLASSKFLANDPANVVPNIIILLSMGVVIGLITDLWSVF